MKGSLRKGDFVLGSTCPAGRDGQDARNAKYLVSSTVLLTGHLTFMRPDRRRCLMRTITLSINWLGLMIRLTIKR
jgi:hypothetical protein